jgi:hypothetical protein
MHEILVGVDLGQFSSFSAACILRRVVLHGIDGQPRRTGSGHPDCRFDVLALTRYPHGTEYLEIVEHVVGAALRPDLRMGTPPKWPSICIDGTGVGVAVAEMFRAALEPHHMINFWSVVITGGRAVTRTGPHSFGAAKVEVAGRLRATLESSRLKIPENLEFAHSLRSEMDHFTMKVTPTCEETFGAGSGQYDDLIMCISIPIFVATQLDSSQVPILGAPGPPVFPGGYKPVASRAVTMNGLYRPSRPPPLEGAASRASRGGRTRLFGEEFRR